VALESVVTVQYRAFLFSIIGEDEFRNLVVWLEDQKIRWYKIEDRGELRNVKSSEWLKTLAKVVCFIHLWMLSPRVRGAGGGVGGRPRGI